MFFLLLTNIHINTIPNTMIAPKIVPYIARVEINPKVSVIETLNTALSQLQFTLSFRIVRGGGTVSSILLRAMPSFSILNII